MRRLPIEPLTFACAYNAVATSTLWFLHHLLYAPTVAPVFDAGFRQQWAAYEAYNREFAEALADAAGTGARVLVQDYHLSLVPVLLRELPRPADRPLLAHAVGATEGGPAAHRAG